MFSILDPAPRCNVNHTQLNTYPSKRCAALSSVPVIILQRIGLEVVRRSQHQLYLIKPPSPRRTNQSRSARTQIDSSKPRRLHVFESSRTPSPVLQSRSNLNSNSPPDCIQDVRREGHGVWYGLGKGKGWMGEKMWVWVLHGSAARARAEFARTKFGPSGAAAQVWCRREGHAVRHGLGEGKRMDGGDEEGRGRTVQQEGGDAEPRVNERVSVRATATCVHRPRCAGGWNEERGRGGVGEGEDEGDEGEVRCGRGTTVYARAGDDEGRVGERGEDEGEVGDWAESRTRWRGDERAGNEGQGEQRRGAGRVEVQCEWERRQDGGRTRTLYPYLSTALARVESLPARASLRA
ncbi:hypothetical protein B0H16DRAFT_1478928 [Mycena metata]|uniref:Uncharacterized protein n=1 Tax=Mycena metata TaxID=1033252 RepID=A0AAD7ME04_9AGAR|nr:hypothetical protein B0H16DRAFT_1478928 [Mycena metata]